MDFYARQAAARTQSRWLVLALAASIAVVVAVLTWMMTAVSAFRSGDYLLHIRRSSVAEFAATHPQVVISWALLWTAIILLASLSKSLMLRGGGGDVARSLGGTRVERDTRDPRLRRLRNVVEEMSIASGVPMPEVWVLEHESGINAFAAGHNPANAAIAVTRGAVATLRRDELQGVIGHEFSHILNGDMRLNIRLMGALFGLMMIGGIGKTIIRMSGASDSRRGSAFLILAVALVVLGYLGLTLGRIIQAAVSRDRERLADASSVQFTRNPNGLKGALLAIAGVPGSSTIVAADREDIAHMLFASGMQRWFATHPSFEERVRALDPSFVAGRLPQLAEKRVQSSNQDDEDDLLAESNQIEMLTKPATASLTAGAPRAATAALPIDPVGIALQVGRPQTAHLDQARQHRLALPVELRQFTDSSGQARCWLLAQLISRDATVRGRQLDMLSEALGQSERAAVELVLPVAARLDNFLRLPAVLQLFPGLRRLARAERETLLGLIERLILADGRIDLFEFCLGKLVNLSLRDELGARTAQGSDNLQSAAGDIAVLFAVIAQQGNSDAVEARRAYEAGISRVLPMERAAYTVNSNWAAALAPALTRLQNLQPFAKRALIEGLVVTIAHDGQLTLPEAELLRTVCATLQCPLPPILPAVPIDEALEFTLGE